MKRHPLPADGSVQECEPTLKLSSTLRYLYTTADGSVELRRNEKSILRRKVGNDFLEARIVAQWVPHFVQLKRAVI